MNHAVLTHGRLQLILAGPTQATDGPVLIERLRPRQNGPIEIDIQVLWIKFQVDFGNGFTRPAGGRHARVVCVHCSRFHGHLFTPQQKIGFK